MQLWPLSVAFCWSPVWAFTPGQTGHTSPLTLRSQKQGNMFLSVSVRLRDRLCPWGYSPRRSILHGLAREERG